MNNTYAEAVVLAQTISNNFDKHWTDSVDVLVCPPSIDLKPVNTVFERLLAAGKCLLGVIERNRGRANKDLAQFADQIDALSNKWDR